MPDRSRPARAARAWHPSSPSARRGRGALAVRALALAALAVTPALAACTRAAGAPAEPDARAAAEARAGVEAMFARGAASWNRGDLDAFVADYVPGTRTTYIGSRGIVRGRAAIRAAYAPRFAPGARRGTLRFENLEVDLLGPGVANAIAYYVLSERTAAGADSTVARGPTSLVMRRDAGGRWRIAHDHSS
jgi:uncharacterized protein (TIGR02246 family)